MLKELTPEEVKSLDIVALVCRMDEVRLHTEEERYGKDFSKFMLSPFPLVSQIMETKIIRDKGEQFKRRVADSAFRFLLQMDLLSVSAGITNMVVYRPEYTEEQWKSPLHWMRVAVLDQYNIIASRIALECFFDLIFVAVRGERMPGDKKFRAFKKWILADRNPFVYFVGHIVSAFEFDRTHRQKEVHGTSRFARSLLTLHKPDTKELNISNRLENVLLSVWQPLIEILNEKKPSSIATFDSSREFARQYFGSLSDPESFSEFVRELITTKMVEPSRPAAS
jgi:hypothetical protein